MLSSILGSTHGPTTSAVACHHRLWAAQTVERRRAWHAIIAFVQHRQSHDVRRCMPSSPLGITQSNDVGSGMPSSTLGSTHDRTTLGVACHHRLWAAQTVERCQAWHAIISLGRQTRSNDVRRDMPSLPLDSTHGQTTSGVACHHRLWAAQTIERRLAWHVIIIFGKHTRSNDVGRGLPSSPLD